VLADPRARNPSGVFSTTAQLFTVALAVLTDAASTAAISRGVSYQSPSPLLQEPVTNPTVKPSATNYQC
jgi:hypothetical protein